ncbi:MAG: hypothetical protein WD059_02940 [Balneolaceae bacterium]
MKTIHKLILKIQRQRILSVIIQCIGLSFFTGILLHVIIGWDISYSSLSGFGVFCIGVGVFALRGQLRKPSFREIARFLDRNYPFMEESSLLLLKEERQGFEFWQKEIVEERLKSKEDQIKLPNSRLKKAAGFAGFWMILAVMTLALQPFLESELGEEISLSQKDEAEKTDLISIPELGEVTISVDPPDYMGRQETNYAWENISVPEQSALTWYLTVNGAVDTVEVVFSDGEVLDFNKKDDFYSASLQDIENGIYQIRLVNADTVVHSDFKSLSVIKDNPPGFVVKKPESSRDFITPNKRDFEIETQIGDDYGITETKINATLARGSGENVRFRERTILFENISGLGSAQVNAHTVLNADSLEMEPGDELYFYITATDNRPSPQTARSETYFIVYADTGASGQGQIAGVAVDIMPEYFRSQRQIIIDTEALLDEQPGIAEEEFNRRSGVIGHDQNLLRKRYGEYLGQDDEMPAEQDEDDHDHEAELNEMGMENEASDAAGIIPDEFFHDHGAAEMNTLFAESPRAMLKQALDHMWNAERYLRTNRPAEALPFEYAALELLKKVQQADRQYTRKAGYELPPIPVDEKRLTGTYDDFANPAEEIISELDKDPLNQLQLLFRGDFTDNKSLAEQGMQLLRKAEISDSDRLFLMNRIRRMENEGIDEEITRQILDRISQIERIVLIDPAPDSRPILTSGSN